MGRNDDAWETLFERHGILGRIAQNGFFSITADEIRTVREPRLMAKFDHQSNLPKVFKKHGLSILPLSRSKYIIGNFNVYQPLVYDTNLTPTSMSLPTDIATINPANLYSESAALHCAHVSGMIKDLLGEEFVPTFSGRMSSASFDFYIQTSYGAERRIEISNAQIEIDGGFESANTVAIIEAKKEKTEDFLIRQLYYPVRLWSEKVHKTIRPIFFTHSNDIFSFFVYEFAELGRYNSLRLLYQKDYIIAHEQLEMADILRVLDQAVMVPEPVVPFPQADSFARVVDLLGLLYENDLSRDEITSNYNFDSRQTNYYTSAGIYLGVVERYTDEGREVRFRLTAEGKHIMSRSFKGKYLSLTECILKHEVFSRVLKEAVDTWRIPRRERIVQLMKECRLYHIHEDSTYYRRAQTISKWIDWILRLPTI